MGVLSVIHIFVMCLVFNVFLPSTDIGSDIYLMKNTLTFQLGNSLELGGCKSCYRKTESEVYLSKNMVENEDCDWFLQDSYFACGKYPLILNEINEHQNKQTSFETNTFRINHENEFDNNDCNETDNCCFVSKYVSTVHRNVSQVVHMVVHDIEHTSF